MDNADVAAHLENLDHRVDRVEQILPTLATKDDLQRAVEPLATKDDLQRAIQSAIEPLATKTQLAAVDERLGAVHERLAELDDRLRGVRVMVEQQRGDIQLIADHVARQSTNSPGS